MRSKASIGTVSANSDGAEKLMSALENGRFQFAAEPWQHPWLRLAHTPGQDLEEQLSRLSYAVLQLDQKQQRYGLELGAWRLDPASGAVQRLSALEALALYGDSRYGH